jgi:TetR/AcrR family transcriptional regulator, cholesterol catabolism regulator
MDEKGQKIISGAADIFMKFGVKSLTMDDVAKHLGVSKKTLYLYVTDKDDLVDKSVTSFCAREDRDITAICAKGLNAIDENFEIMHWVLSVLHQIHPAVSFDIEKYHPDVFKKMVAHRQERIYSCIFHNLKKGQKEGFFRKDLNADIIAKLYIGRIDRLFDQNLFPITQYKIADVYKEEFKYHIRGVASAKGIEYLETKMKSIKI